MASPAVFNELLSTTINHWKRSAVDQIAQHNALFGWMNANKSWKYDIDGGDYLEIPLIMSENETIQNFGGYDLLQTGVSEPTKTVKFPWSQKAITISISGEEMRKNNGKAKIISISKTRADAARTTCDNRLAIEVYSDGTIADGLAGLAALIRRDGLGTVGGLSGSTYTNWRNQFKDAGATITSSNVFEFMTELEIECTIGKEHPDLSIATNDVFVAMQKYLSANTRYDNPYMGSKGAAMGFRSILLAPGHEIIHDANVNFGAAAAGSGVLNSVQQAYMLTTKYFYGYTHPDANWAETPNLTPINQDSLLRRLIWMGGIALENRRQQGLLFQD